MLQYLPSHEDLGDLEIRTIAEMKELGCSLVNLTTGGDGVRGRVVTFEQRRKLSEVQKRRFNKVDERAAASLRTLAYLESHPEARIANSNRAKDRQSKMTTEEKGQINEKRSASLLEHYSDQGVRDRLAAAHRNSWANDQTRRDSLSTRMTMRFSDPNEREKQSAIQTKRYADPEERKKTSDSIRTALATPEAKRVKSDASKSSWALKTTEERAAWAAAIKAGHARRKAGKLPLVSL